jgi:hypothetical protein
MLPRFIQKYDDETMEPLPLELPPGQQRLHFIYQDESAFHANALEEKIYLLPGEQPLRKKGQGRLVHVSDFIIENTGRLSLSEEQIYQLKNTGQWTPSLEEYNGDARKIIYPGKNHDAWWDLKQLIAQVRFPPVRSRSGADIYTAKGRDRDI